MQHPDADEQAVRARSFAWAAGGLLLTVVLVVVAVMGGLRLIGVAPGGERLRRAAAPTLPGPVLQAAPQPELDAYLRDQHRRLESLGWVDRAQGVAHIPIDEAIALSVRRGASDDSADLHRNHPRREQGGGR